MKLLTLPTSLLAPSDLYKYIEVLQQKKHNALKYEVSVLAKGFYAIHDWPHDSRGLSLGVRSSEKCHSGQKDFLGSLGRVWLFPHKGDFRTYRSVDWSLSVHNNRHPVSGAVSRNYRFFGENIFTEREFRQIR